MFSSLCRRLTRRPWFAAESNCRTVRKPACTMRPRLESLEDRRLLSGSTGIFWDNRGDSMNDSDSFNAVFGAQADAARNVVDAALRAWNQVVTNFNYSANDPNPHTPNGWDPLNSFAIDINVDPSKQDIGGSGTSTDFDGGGKPFAGEITLGAGTDGHGAGFFIDPTSGDSTEFRGKILNAFAGLAQNGSPAIGNHDLFSLVTSETAHALGINDNSNGAFFANASAYLQTTNLPDAGMGGQGTLWTFTAPGVNALYTTWDSGAPNHDKGFPVHLAEPPDAFTANGTTYSGIIDANNGTYAYGERLLPSNLDARILGAIYGYTVNANPGQNQNLTGFDTFYANLDQTTGNLLIRGGTDGSNSNDLIEVQRANTQNPPLLLISTMIGSPVAGTPTNVFNTYEAGVKSITIQAGDGSDQVILDQSMGDMFPANGITVDDALGDGTSPPAGGATTDSLTLFGTPTAEVFTLTNAQVAVLNGNGINSQVKYKNVESLGVTAGAGDDNIDVQSTSPAVTQLTIDAGAGNDGVQIEMTSAATRVNMLNGPGYNTVDVGGSARSAFGGPGPINSAHDVRGPIFVDGLAGFDQLNINDQGNTLATKYTLTAGVVTRDDGQHTLPITYSGLEGMAINGGKASDMLVGPDQKSLWRITGANKGDVDALPASPSGRVNLVTFASVEKLTGGAQADTFVLKNAAASESGPIDGGLGAANTLVGPDATTNDWLVKGPNKGVLSVNAVPPSARFTNVQDLHGGTGVDNFRVAMTGSVSAIDGGDGGDWIDYSLFDSAHPVTVDLSAGTATGVTGGIAKIQNAIGGRGDDKLTGGPGGNILVGGRGNDTLIGGMDGNVLIGGQGQDTVTAGAFGDTVIGGTTDFDSSTDAHRAALQGILSEWRLDFAYFNFRVQRLENGGDWGIWIPPHTPGYNGAAVLNSTTVHDDAAPDTLNLGAGVDWYFQHQGLAADVINGASASDLSYNY